MGNETQKQPENQPEHFYNPYPMPPGNPGPLNCYHWASSNPSLKRVGKSSPRSLFLSQWVKQKLLSGLFFKVTGHKEGYMFTVKFNCAALALICDFPEAKAGWCLRRPPGSLPANVRLLTDLHRTRLPWAADQGWPVNYISCLPLDLVIRSL